MKTKAKSTKTKAKSTTEEDATRRLKRLGTLLEISREFHNQIAETLEEMRKLVAGEKTIGDLMRQATRSWGVVWDRHYRSAYAWQGVKDSAQLKRLLKTFKIEDLEARMIRFLEDADPFLVKAGHPFALFASVVNRYPPLTHAKASADAPPVGDCKHDPGCTTDQEHTKRSLRDVRR